MLGQEEEKRAAEFIAWKQNSLNALKEGVEGIDA
jgi:hypothetical protein